MGWSIGYDGRWKRDVGYGVPATCDHPRCEVEIDRGLSYVCGGEPYGGDYGCGLFFCAAHMGYRHPRGSGRAIKNCARCRSYRPPYRAKPDCLAWLVHKLAAGSWAAWRKEHPNEVARMKVEVKRQRNETA